MASRTIPARETLRILIIEDCAADAALIERTLRANGCPLEMTVVCDAAGLASTLREAEWDVILSDYALPGFDALDAFAIVREACPKLPFVVVSGTVGEERAVELIKLGITDYILKDNLARLWSVVERAVNEAKEHAALDDAHRRLVLSEQEWHKTFDAISDGILLLDSDCKIHRANRAAAGSFGGAVEDVVGQDARQLFKSLCTEQSLTEDAFCCTEPVEFELGPCINDGTWFDISIDPVLDGDVVPDGFVVILTNITARKHAEQELQSLVEQLESSIRGSVSIAAHMVEKRDPYTAGHQEGVALVAVQIAEQLGLSPKRIELIRTASILHDIGKIAVPAEILVKPGGLDEYEWLIMQRHPLVGADILDGAELGGPIAEIVRQHHERLDGSGYPAGLVGDAICLEARIIGVADVTEAMLAHRPYRPARSLEETTAELKLGRGTRYDADIVDACLATLKA